MNGDQKAQPVGSELDEITNGIIKQAILMHIRLGPGLLVGLLINFGEATLRQGLFRMVNNLEPSKSPILRLNQSDPNSDKRP